MSAKESSWESFTHKRFLASIKNSTRKNTVTNILLETYIKLLGNANINKQWADNGNFTILLSVMEASRCDLVKYLFDTFSDTIDVNVPDVCGYTAIFYLGDIVKIKDDEYTKTHWREISKLIIDKTENINHIGRDGMTALMRLMTFTKLRSMIVGGYQNQSNMEMEIAMMLLEKGANINMMSVLKKNALDYACGLKYANYQVIEMLIKEGANITQDTIQLAKRNQKITYYTDSGKTNNQIIIDLLTITMRRNYEEVINTLPQPIAEEIIEHFFITE